MPAPSGSLPRLIVTTRPLRSFWSYPAKRLSARPSLATLTDFASCKSFPAALAKKPGSGSAGTLFAALESPRIVFMQLQMPHSANPFDRYSYRRPGGMGCQRRNQGEDAKGARLRWHAKPQGSADSRHALQVLRRTGLPPAIYGGWLRLGRGVRPWGGRLRRGCPFQGGRGLPG